MSMKTWKKFLYNFDSTNYEQIETFSPQHAPMGSHKSNSTDMSWEDADRVIEQDYVDIIAANAHRPLVPNDSPLSTVPSGIVHERVMRFGGNAFASSSTTYGPSTTPLQTNDRGMGLVRKCASVQSEFRLKDPTLAELSPTAAFIERKLENKERHEHVFTQSISFANC